VVVVGEEDAMIIDCYRLAKYYGISPMIFLDMTFSEVAMHLRRTAQLARAQQED
jgi:hypothetical protein